jgi:hypothetical protein
VVCLDSSRRWKAIVCVKSGVKSGSRTANNAKNQLMLVVNVIVQKLEMWRVKARGQGCGGHIARGVLDTVIGTGVGLSRSKIKSTTTRLEWRNPLLALAHCDFPEVA